MTGDEIRAAYLRFFEARGHKVMPSISLIPYGDPTLLLTSAGMVPFKSYFLGEQVPPSRRLTSCQKCFRTTDIDSVGDARHLTFFEMLGNFSIGDYFKAEATSWAWEFVTKELRLPPSRLWVTVFHDDDEAFNYWRKIGVPSERILRLGEADNFWGPAGNSGPCGPCSEILYDFGEGVGCGKETCAPGCDCGRYLEIWNLVFTQYNQDENGNRTPLPRPNIDTGMGLERITAVMQGQTSVYGTDFFTPLLVRVAEIAGRDYGADEALDHAMRVVAEHGRAVTFLIADGVLPANEGRGYVLRRLIRRAALFGRRLAEGKPFTSEVAKAAILKMGGAYPEIVAKRDFILKVIDNETARFGETLSTGLALLDGIVSFLRSRGESQVPGDEAFRLYDTYGFPVEMTKEIACGYGFTVDLAGFEAEMAKQRERARSSHRFETKISARGGESFDIKTCFVGYDSLGHRSEILRLLVNGEAVDRVAEGEEAGIVLAATPFYAEMGGQVGDTGEIVSPQGRFAVTNTVYLTPDVLLHQGKMTDGILAVGDEVGAMVNPERRRDIARNHTATHLLQAALRQVLGGHVAQHGSLVTPDRLRFDFSHLEALSPEELQKVSRFVNERIRENRAVSARTVPYQEAIKEGAIALFSEKYGDTVRLVRVEGTSAELCGGTHIGATGEIGLFQVVAESSIGAGVRRIEAVTGRGAEEFVAAQSDTLHKVSAILGASVPEAQDKVTALVAELENERRRALSLERELARRVGDSLLSEVVMVNDIKIVAARVPESGNEALRELADRLRDKLGSAVIVLGTVQGGKPFFLAVVAQNLVARGYSAKDIVNRVAEVTGGKGGGKPQFAQAGGKDVAKLDEALGLVSELVREVK